MRVLRAILTVQLAAAAALSEAQWSGVAIYEENDTLVFFDSDARDVRTTDQFYTQGLRFVFPRDASSTWSFGTKLRKLIESGDCRDKPASCYRTRTSLVVGQTLETPRTITTFLQNRFDRPYTGYLFAGVRADIVRDDERKRHAFEATVGFLGAPALAKPTQKGFHALRGHRIPKGWNFELGTEPQANLLYTFERRFVADRAHFYDLPLDVDATFYGTGALGTVQTYAGAGATIRAGFNLSGFPQTPGTVTIPAGPPPKPPPDPPTTDSEKEYRRALEKVSLRDLEFGVFYGYDARRVVRNAYLDGNLLGGSPSSIRRRPWVKDQRYGATIRHRSLRLTYTRVHRSLEFDPVLEPGQPEPPAPPKEHRFGSFVFEWTPDLWPPSPSSERSWFWKDWQLDIGLGSGIARITESGMRGRTRPVPSGRLAFAKGLTDRFTFGGEYVGAVQEGAPPTSGSVHHDTFLHAIVSAFGVRPLGGQHPLQVRVGFGQAKATREITRNGMPDPTESDKGLAFTASVEYLFRIGNPWSFGVSATWGHLKIDDSPLSGGQFLSSNLTIRWFPLGRWH